MNDFGLTTVGGIAPESIAFLLLFCAIALLPVRLIALPSSIDQALVDRTWWQGMAQSSTIQS